MSRKLVAALTLLVPGFVVQPACVPAVRPSAAASGVEVVHVAPPTGMRETDRASILAALAQVQPGGTVQFAPGTYLVGNGIRVTMPRVTMVGHRDGTTLRGCDPALITDLRFLASTCNGLELEAGHQTVRDLNFEHAYVGVYIGAGMRDTAQGAREGADLVTGNTFRTGYGIIVEGAWANPAIIRGNRFINTFHGIGIAGGTVHLLDNHFAVPQPEQAPIAGFPSDAVMIAPRRRTAGDELASTCGRNVVAGNHIEGSPYGIQIAVFEPGSSCRGTVVRDNTIEVRRVRSAAPGRLASGFGWTDRSDSTFVGVPIVLHNYTVTTASAAGAEQPGVIEDNLIEGNRIIGGEGPGMHLHYASRNRIVNNTFTDIRLRDPFPGHTIDRPELGPEANGAGIWVSPGSNENEIVGNTFEDIASHAVVLEGDRNRVETRSASDAVRDLGSGNRVRAPPAAREGYAPGADGVRLFYRVEGRGPDTVVVLHGGPSLGFAYLAPDLEPLGAEFTLLYYDQRGIGRSSRPDDNAELAVARHVEDLEALRRHFGLDRLILVGHSWGGMLAARYAAAYPRHVERLLLLEPMAPARTPFMAEGGARAQQLMQERLDSLQRARLDSLYRSWAGSEDPVSHCQATYGALSRAYFEDPAAAERARGDFCAGAADVVASRPQVDAAILGSLGEWDLRPLLAGIEVPVLIVHGSGSAIPLEAMQAWTRALPNARLMVVPDAGHYLHVDRPEVFFPAAVEFLRGGPRSSGERLQPYVARMPPHPPVSSRASSSPRWRRRCPW